MPQFSVEAANALVPFLKERFQRIAELEEQLAGAREDLKTLSAIWGKQVLEPGNPDRQLYRRNSERLGSLAAELKACLRAVADKGCMVRSALEVDLPHEAGIVLCWKRSEERVAFWHPVAASLAARRPLEELAVRIR